MSIYKPTWRQRGVDIVCEITETPALTETIANPRHESEVNEFHTRVRAGNDVSKIYLSHLNNSIFAIGKCKQIANAFLNNDKSSE